MESLRIAACATVSALVAGLQAEDWTAKRAEWESFKQNFKADYSDGSKLLQPTEGNRFAAPFVVTTPDGKPACSIRYATGSWWDQRLANETTKKAAEELQALVKLLTGVSLPINPVRAPESALPAINVGKGRLFPFCSDGKEGKGPLFGKQSAAEAFWGDLAFLRGSDGYAIRTVGKDLCVYGVMEKGALNGVYALLENNTDIVFARPNEKYGTVFTPQTNGLSLVWGEGVRSRPASTWRGFWHLTNQRYYSANGLSVLERPWSENLPYRRYGHNVNYYAGGHAHAFAEKSTFETNPEFYGLVAGVRDRVYGNQLCFTNPKLKPVFIENVLKEMDRWTETEMAGINFSLDDSMNWCECEACAQPIVLEDGTVVRKDDPAFMSTRYFLFVNDVARALAEAHPGKRIKTLAYFQTVEPPKCRIEPNVDVEFCPYLRLDDAVPVFMPDNEKWISRAAGWHRLVGHKVLMYGYNGLGLCFPKPLAHVHQRDFREYFRYLSGINSEGPCAADNADEPFEKATVAAREWDFSAVEFWLMHRLYWDAEQDVELLYKKFIWRTFREAARPVERFYGIIREEWMRQTAKSSIGEPTLTCMQRIVMKPGHEAELRACLGEAKKLVCHSTSKVLVERLSAVFEKYLADIRAQKTSALNVPQVVPQGKVGFDDPAWASAGVIDGFWAMPKGDAPSKSPTEMRLFHDGKRLYVKGIFREDMSRCHCSKLSGESKDGISEGSMLETFIVNPSVPGEYYLYQVDAAGNVCDFLGSDSSWNRKEATLVTRTAADRWEALLTFPLREIGCDLTKGNEIKAAFIRLRQSSDPARPTGRESDYGAWRWCMWHQLNTFGTLTLQR